MKRVWDDARVSAANAAQLKTLQPGKNVWISANAGTGKTEVLTRRLLSLLVADQNCPPRAILALTFTKAGAAEMAARLPRKLAELSALPEAQLAAWLHDALGLEGTARACARIRELQAQVAAEPPLVRTIHGFAQELLQRFPDEAGVPQGFSILEEADTARLLQEAQSLALEQADDDTGRAVDTLVGEIGEYGWRELTHLTRVNWPKISGLLSHSGGVGPLLAQLQVALGLEGDTAPEEAPLLPGPEALALLRDILDISEHSLAEEVLAAATSGDALLLEEAWLAFHFTQSGTPRARLVKASISKARPDIAAAMTTEQEALSAARARQSAWRTMALTQAFLIWGGAVQSAFGTLKRNRGALDYQDLLDAVERLLLRNESGFRDWVLYRLDRQFRHLLVDEAQDNSPQQARLVALLAQEFVQTDNDGDGAPRTVLAVGDVKQSIYRFQGARPEFFLELRDLLGRLGHLVEIDMRHSFRTSEAVLASVDAVFSPAGIATAVQGEHKDWPTHASVFSGQFGRVEVWPLAVPPEPPRPAPWTLPMDRPAQVRGVTVCARAVAERIVGDIAAGTILPSTGRRMGAGDVLVLTRTNANRDAVMRELRAAGLPVSGGSLTLEHPALADLFALLRILHNPDDRLAFATVLKGRLAGWSDARLLELHRLGPDWWSGLGQLDAPLKAALHSLRTAAGSEPPAALLGRLVHMFKVPVRYGRNPVEVADIRAACDNLALLLESTPTLAMAIARLEDGVELAGAQGNGVRVMTAHKSKGLEAPVVVLADTTQPLADTAKEKLLWLEHGNRLGGVIYRIPATRATDLQTAADAAEKELQRADSLRLLYVAMTRARDVLWIAGWEGRAGPDDCWYGLVTAGMERLDGATRLDDGRIVFGTGTAPAADDSPQETAAVARLDVAAGKPLSWPEKDAGSTPLPTPAMAYGENLHAWLAAAPNPDASAPAEIVRIREAFPELFSDGSHGEVEVMLTDGRLGRIDRLVVRDDEIWIIDFKSGQPVSGAIPAAYARQLEGYRGALEPLAGGRRLRAGIVWTADARLQWLA